MRRRLLLLVVSILSAVPSWGLAESVAVDRGAMAWYDSFDGTTIYVSAHSVEKLSTQNGIRPSDQYACVIYDTPTHSEFVCGPASVEVDPLLRTARVTAIIPVGTGSGGSIVAEVQWAAWGLPAISADGISRSAGASGKVSGPGLSFASEFSQYDSEIRADVY